MNIGKACAIFQQIDSNKYTDIEKGEAIRQVLKMPTHNSVNKDTLLNVIKWLFNQMYEVNDSEF